MIVCTVGLRSIECGGRWSRFHYVRDRLVRRRAQLHSRGTALLPHRYTLLDVDGTLNLKLPRSISTPSRDRFSGKVPRCHGAQDDFDDCALSMQQHVTVTRGTQLTTVHMAGLRFQLFSNCNATRPEGFSFVERLGARGPHYPECIVANND
jgi:hypothetical protein